MRGKERAFPGCTQQLGITPAYAGKRLSRRQRRRGTWDHPRVCGEKSSFVMWQGCCTGSPPRMRGKVLAALMPENRLGITPAYAGKRGEINTYEKIQRDHPRVCGEKICCTAIACRSSGSPPRMRGKVAWVNIALLYEGITPAYAGKSCFQICTHKNGRDHPRVCGEKTSSRPPAWNTPGSPPRMRGKGNPLFAPLFQLGITPAYAGKSCPGPASGRPLKDHPRVCGEKLRSFISVFQIGGSPPRMRGKD